MKKISLLSMVLATNIFAAGVDIDKVSGIWYESDFGEQTIWLNKDGSCKFNRGTVTLFDFKNCKFNAKGEMILNYKGSNSKVYMQNQEQYLLISTNFLITRYTADAVLEKKSNFKEFSKNMAKKLTGQWEMADHSSKLSLKENNICNYTPSKQDKKVDTICTWMAGKKGACLVFADKNDTTKTSVMFVKLVNSKLLLSNEKNELLPTRAKYQMVRIKN